MQKNNVTKFWPTGFFLIYDFLLFEKKRKGIKDNKLINNQNQKTFIVIIIKYELRVFFSVFALQNIIF